MSEGQTSGNGRMTEPDTPSSLPGLTRPSTAACENGVDARVKPGHDERRGRVAKRLAAIGLTLIVVVATALTAYTISLGPLSLQDAKALSTTVVDRHGKLLRAYAMADGRWRLPVSAQKDVDPTYLKLVFAYEDQRFYDHHGVDPRALARAAIQFGSH
ncbi:MAG: transglycosylase domain-containing protein, partial [Bradyrhizobium sp.]|nr:transglycosylase domain-containing protein [Bradyrhizobium sp.]